MAKRKVTVETPGEPSAPDADRQPENTQAASSTTPDARPAAPSPAPSLPPAGVPETPTILQAKEQTLAQEVIATKRDLVGSAQALDWSHLTQPASIVEQISHIEGEKNLPDSSEIDPAAIPFGQQRLSRQGWVVSTQPNPRAGRY